jgi:hypothetical protein
MIKRIGSPKRIKLQARAAQLARSTASVLPATNPAAVVAGHDQQSIFPFTASLLLGPGTPQTHYWQRLERRHEQPHDIRDPKYQLYHTKPRAAKSLGYVADKG